MERILNMKFGSILQILSVAFMMACSVKSKVKHADSTHPNIIILYVDDLGYADVGIYGAKGVQTPNIDSLARFGIKFTDAHSSAATCTPSRYSLLTGNYAFRNNAEILPGDAPLLIDTARSTLPKILKKAGYRTAVVGKWHLGLGLGSVDWNGRIAPGPNEIGFDHSFLIPATGDRVPTVFVKDGFVQSLDTEDPIEVNYQMPIGNRPIGLEHPELLKVKADSQHSASVVNGISRIGYMAGGQSAEWIDEDFPYVLTEKAADFIESSGESPFFLYYSFHDIHVPRIPHENFKGSSSMGARGDAIVQVDYVVGQICKILREAGKLNETLIIFTSDNGPVLNDGYEDEAVELAGEHNPSGPFRGGKYSIYEAGTRVPTIVYWPDSVKSKVSSALVNQVDLVASLATLVGQQVPEDVIDSQDQLEAWLGLSDKGRTYMIEEGFTFALRHDQWKYIHPLASERTIPAWMKNKDIEHGLSSEVQLYNLESDIQEQVNLADQMPDKIQEMREILETTINN